MPSEAVKAFMLFPSAPISYAVEITFACNNACSGCSNIWKARRHQRLQNWQFLLDRIAPPENRGKYAELIRITGGEPSLHPEFRQIIEYADTFGIPHALFSSGRWENPDEVIRTYLKCKNFIGMLISLHGSTKVAHNAFVRTSHAFEETCNNIRRASEAGLEVFTNTVLTVHSCGQIEDIISLSQELGAGCAVFNRFLAGDHPLQPSEDQLRETVLLIEKLQRQGVSCHIGNCIPKCFVKNSSEGANAGIEHCNVSPEGLVRPDNLSGYVFGNILEQPIEEIWASEPARHYRDRVPKACFECAELSRCRGGEKSLIAEYGFNKDPLMKEPVRESETETIILSPELKPVPYFNLRKESFGYLLTRYNWSVPVSSEAKAIADAINSRNTIEQLQEQFGDDVLNFIGYLYRERCIGFE